jgi:hypothetical protein
MTDKEAMAMALEALEADELDMVDDGSGNMIFRKEQAITAIKEALAQPEPWSPVSIGVDVTKEGAHVVGIYALDKDTSQIFYAKYHYAKDPQASQRKWVGLTDDEIWGTISRIGTSDSDVNPYAKLADARAIEAKLKEKNT